MSYLETEHLRVLIANERKDRLALVAPIVVALGHEVIAREIEVDEVGPVTARERPDVALVGLGEIANLPRLPAHAHFHFLMGGIYTFVGAVLLGVVAWTLLRTGSRSGWYAILFALVVGGSIELWAASTIFPHGFPPHSIPLGLFLYAYIPAFACALAISYQPIFRSKSAKQLADECW